MINNHNHQEIEITILFIISTFFSTFTSLVTCIIYILYGSLKLGKNYPGRLVFLIAVCDFIVWCDRFINVFAKFSTNYSLEERSEYYCLISSIFCCFFGLINACATFLIVFSIFLEIVFFINPKKYEKIGYFISILFSLSLSLIPLWRREYGILDDYQCWINYHTTNFFVFYFPIIIVFVSDFLFIGYILHYLHKMKHVVEVNGLCKKLLMFPSILLISWTPGLIRSLYDCDNIILEGFMYFFMPLQGVFNPLIYGSMFKFLRNKQRKCLIASITKPPEISHSKTEDTQEDEIN